MFCDIITLCPLPQINNSIEEVGLQMMMESNFVKSAKSMTSDDWHVRLYKALLMLKCFTKTEIWPLWRTMHCLGSSNIKQTEIPRATSTYPSTHTHNRSFSVVINFLVPWAVAGPSPIHQQAGGGGHTLSRLINIIINNITTIIIISSITLRSYP